MKNFGRAVTIMGVVAGSTSLASMVIVGCSGDDTVKDGGSDGRMDMGLDALPDTPPVDGSADAGDAGDTGDLVLAFRLQTATSFCTRFQNCCNGADAGTFDFNKCVQTAGLSAWNGSNAELTGEILARGNVQIDNTAAQTCLAGLATLSCPVVTSGEFTTVTDSCYAAATGKLAVGANCVKTIECQKGEYCKFAGVDAGKTDAGSTLGACANLIAQGQTCGQTPPYGDPNYLSTECAYKGWHSPAEFCDYDTFPDASGYKCQSLRTNGSACFFDNECSSSLCGNLFQNCVQTACSCQTSRDYIPLCNLLKIKDAGPG